MEVRAAPCRKFVAVCCHQRDPQVRASCGAAYREAEGGSGFQLLKALKQTVRQRGLTEVRVVKSGCQGLCESGPAVSVWPAGRAFTRVTLAEAEALLTEAEAEAEALLAEAPRGAGAPAESAQ